MSHLTTVRKRVTRRRAIVGVLSLLLVVLLVAMVGLWRRRGSLLAVAAMAKMSPALYLFAWAARKAWRQLLLAIAMLRGQQ